ncbi:MAG: helix-turn-helix domain-containing protein [Clostridia bacterium]|jgi:DNA-binding transcriptional ArsR family regulator|nr:helix-turn-helix transcriptional regulator [Clostridiaceae bacterium]
MEYDCRKEIERLRKEIEDLKERFGRMERISSKEPLKKPHIMRNEQSNPESNRIMDSLLEISEKENRTGSVTCMGVFRSSGRQSQWITESRNTDDLLALIEIKLASAVLQCIGNSDRLNLLLTLLRTPMTVASLVEKCGFNTTGQAYHHLKPLIAADLVYEVEQGERGVYAVRPHRVQGIIMLLAGIADLTDPRYSRGNWISDEREDK